MSYSLALAFMGREGVQFLVSGAQSRKPFRCLQLISFRLHDASPPIRRLNRILVRLEDRFLARIIGLSVLHEVVGAGVDDTSLPAHLWAPRPDARG
jgi:hypothetical protein